MGQQQLECAGKSLFSVLFPDQVRTAEHVAPLVVSAHFEAAAVAMEQLQEVVALHQHVGELQEAEAVLGRHTGLVAVRGEHLVDGELGADIAHKLDEVQVAQPVAVIDDDGVSFAEIQETGHLLFDALHVAVNGFRGQHFPHVRLAGGIADHGGSAAHQGNRLMAGPLHMRHRHDRDVMADMQAVRGGIKTDVKYGRLFQLFVKLVLKRYLRDKSALFQDVQDMFHVRFPLIEWFRQSGPSGCPCR